MRKGYGLIPIPKLSQWNVIMAQFLCNHLVQALQLNHNRNLMNTYLLITRDTPCKMATPRNWHCLGCRDDLKIRKRIIDHYHRSGVQKSIIATEAVEKIQKEQVRQFPFLAILLVLAVLLALAIRYTGTRNTTHTLLYYSHPGSYSHLVWHSRPFPS